MIPNQRAWRFLTSAEHFAVASANFRIGLVLVRVMVYPTTQTKAQSRACRGGKKYRVLEVERTGKTFDGSNEGTKQGS